MFMPPLPPPEPPPRITAMEVGICPAHDPKCYFDLANDVLEGVARGMESSARSFSGNTVRASGTDGVGAGDSGAATVTPGTGQATWTGFAPEVITRPTSL
jgi:hypothetical protein